MSRLQLQFKKLLEDGSMSACHARRAGRCSSSSPTVPGCPPPPSARSSGDAGLINSDDGTYKPG